MKTRSLALGQSEIEFLKTLTEEERLAYILGQQTAADAKRILLLAHGLMNSSAERNALTNKVKAEWILNHDQGYANDDNNELSKGSQFMDQANTIREQWRARKAKFDEETNLHYINEKEILRNHRAELQSLSETLPQEQEQSHGRKPATTISFSMFEGRGCTDKMDKTTKADPFMNGDPATDPAAAMAAGVALPAGSVYKPGVGFVRPAPKPDRTEQMANEISELIGSAKYKGPFAQYAKAIDAGNTKQLYDEDSSVPYRGLVMSSRQTEFAIQQGNKLDKLLKDKGISPLNASPADRDILKRADAAIRENQLQRLDFSQSVMMESEQRVMQSIDKFKKGSLIKALPDMIAAQSPEDIKSAFDAAVSSEAVNRNEAAADIRAIDTEFMGYGKAVEAHASNLIKDGQEDAAIDLISQFKEKAKQMGKEGFLDELTNKGFDEKTQEMSKKFAEMIRNLVQNLLGSMRSGPQMKPE